MINFNKFIEKDIAAKRTLITTMPTKTKTNKKKFNENIDSLKEKYTEYSSSVRNYLLAKSRSFEVKDTETEEDIEKLNETVIELEHVKFLLNPSNTYFEKMAFDDLLYQISNYYVFNFRSLNEIINGFLDKFELIGVKLTSDDFDYTCYVHEYMTSFLEVRYNKKKKYDKVSEIFEQIYWLNPDIIEHIELNFRKLIRQNDKKFNNYILKLQKEVMATNHIRSYVDCLEKLKSAHIELNMANKEGIYELISLAKSGELDVNQLLDTSKIRKTAFESLVPDTIDINEQDSLNKFCVSLEKLKSNVVEYDNYVEFIPLFESFKDEYKELISSEEKKGDYKGLKNIETLILAKEKELEKLNNKIFGSKPGFFEFKTDKDLKILKVESVQRAKELYELYKEKDKEYFKDKVLEILNNSITVADVLNLYFSFDYFKKLAIQKVYKITDYNEIIKYSNNFDLYAMDPTNIIITGTPIFDSVNIPKIITNKYRLNNIKISEDDLAEENLEQLLNKIVLILRVNIVLNSSSSIDKLWFIANVEKIVKAEAKKE